MQIYNIFYNLYSFPSMGYSCDILGGHDHHTSATWTIGHLTIALNRLIDGEYETVTILCDGYFGPIAHTLWTLLRMLRALPWKWDDVRSMQTTTLMTTGHSEPMVWSRSFERSFKRPKSSECLSKWVPGFCRVNFVGCDWSIDHFSTAYRSSIKHMIWLNQ